MKEITFGTKFYSIEQEMFHYTIKKCVVDNSSDEHKLLSYPKVVPVYVYSMIDIWDGTREFSICPIDFTDPKESTKSWRWQRAHKESDIGKTIYEDEASALQAYNTRYSEEQIIKHKELAELQFVLNA